MYPCPNIHAYAAQNRKFTVELSRVDKAFLTVIESP